MKSLVVLLVLLGNSAFAVETKVSIPQGINLVKVTVEQKNIPGCGPEKAGIAVLKTRENKVNKYYVGNDQNLDEKKLAYKLHQLNETNTCPSFYTVEQTAQFLAFGPDEITVVIGVPWTIKGQPEIQTLK